MPAGTATKPDSRERLIAAARELLWQGSYGTVSVDDICRAAGVNKGSFYHFFPAKAELAAVAVGSHWDEMRPALDAMFSPLVPPLERIERYCAAAVRIQEEWHREHGRVLGCPYTSLGCETSADACLGRIASAKYELTVRYFTAAIAEAQRAGQAPVVGDPGELAQEVQAYVIGVMSQARVAASLAPLARLLDGIHRIIGVARMEAR